MFSDRGTPSEKWNAYDALRDSLVAKGMPKSSIRFIHEAAGDDEKAKLFAACRDGRVSVIIGSTEKMGTGTNIQARAVALHHRDCPWRPADVTQREGRIIRQGNQNEEVSIFRYVTRGSFDAYMWQTVTRKAKFIEQVLTGKLDVREVDDISESVMSYAEITAVAAVSIWAEVGKQSLLRDMGERPERASHALDVADALTDRAVGVASLPEMGAQRSNDLRAREWHSGRAIGEHS